MAAIMCTADTVKCTCSCKNSPDKINAWNMLLEYCLLSTSQKSSYFTQFFEYMEILNIHFDQFWFILAAIMNQSWLPMAICVSDAHQHHIPGISPGSRFGKLRERGYWRGLFGSRVMPMAGQHNSGSRPAALVFDDPPFAPGNTP